MTKPGSFELAIERLQKLDELNRQWTAAKTPQQRWAVLRATYAIMTPLILKGRVDPYFLDWTRHRTPIEELAWVDIRSAGLPMYPQYPALRYLLDFADPVQKIAVELDGAAWHDEQRDRVRDEALLKAGWRTFRIPGKRSLASGVDAMQIVSGCQSEVEAVRALAEWGCAWSEGFFWALGVMFYSTPRFPGLSSEASREAAIHILSYHQLIEFPLEDGEDDE